MAHKIATGLKVPALATVSNIYCDDCVSAAHPKSTTTQHQSQLFQPAGALLLVLGLIMLASCLIWGAWARLVLNSKRHSRKETPIMMKIIDFLQASPISFGSHRLYENI